MGRGSKCQSEFGEDPAVFAAGCSEKGVPCIREGCFEAKGRKIEATYSTPLMAHAPMEPGNCTASFQEEVEVWAPTQDPQDCQKAIADALGVDVTQVTLHVTLLGGVSGGGWSTITA